MKAKEFISEMTSRSVVAVAMPLGSIQSRTGTAKKKKKDTKTKESGLQRYTGIKKVR